MSVLGYERYVSFAALDMAFKKRKFGADAAQNGTVSLEIPGDSVTMSWPTVEAFRKFLSTSNLKQYDEMYDSIVVLRLTTLQKPEWDLLDMKSSLQDFNTFKAQTTPGFQPLTAAQLVVCLFDNLPEKERNDLASDIFYDIYKCNVHLPDRDGDVSPNWVTQSVYKAALAKAGL